MYVKLAVFLVVARACTNDFLNGLGCHLFSGFACNSWQGITWATGSCTTVLIEGTLTVFGTVNVTATSLVIADGASLTATALIANVETLSVGDGASLIADNSSLSASQLEVLAGATLGCPTISCSYNCVELFCPVDILVGSATVNGTIQGGDLRISATSNLDINGLVDASGSIMFVPSSSSRRRTYHHFPPEGNVAFPTMYGYGDSSHVEGGYQWSKGGGRILLEACGVMSVYGTITADSVGGNYKFFGVGGSIFMRALSVVGTGSITSVGTGLHYNADLATHNGYGGNVAVHAQSVEEGLQITSSPGNFVNYFEANGPELLHYPRFDDPSHASRPSCAGIAPTPSPSVPASCNGQEAEATELNLTVTVPALPEGGNTTVACPRSYLGYATVTCAHGQVTVDSSTCSNSCTTRRLAASALLPGLVPAPKQLEDGVGTRFETLDRGSHSPQLQGVRPGQFLGSPSPPPASAWSF